MGSSHRHERLKDSWGSCAILSQGEGAGILNYTGKEENSQENGKSKCLVNKCLPHSAATMGLQGDLEETGPAKLPPTPHSLLLSLVIVPFLDQDLDLNSFRKLRGR